jgi:hypothetical protein
VQQGGCGPFYGGAPAKKKSASRSGRISSAASFIDLIQRAEVPTLIAVIASFQ